MGWHKKTDAEIEAETDEIMRQINANVIAEGCVFKCTNIIQQRFGEPPFELPQFKRSLRKVVETAVKRRQVKKIFGTNKVGDVMEDEAVISQIKYMLEERYGHGYYTFEAVDPAALHRPWPFRRALHRHTGVQSPARGSTLRPWCWGRW